MCLHNMYVLTEIDHDREEICPLNIGIDII